MNYRIGDDPRRALLAARLRSQAQVPVIVELESDDPCLLCDAPPEVDDDGIASCPFEIVLVDDAFALAA